MTQQRDGSTLKDSDLGLLIQELGPLNNRWRGENPTSKVLTLWDMGDALLKMVTNPDDQLLWNIQERSYITRNLLRYALIVRRGWTNRQKLEEIVRGLRSYSVFREALPFLKGNHAGVDDVTYQKVVSLLHEEDTNSAITYLKSLKLHSMDRGHKKGASTLEIREDAAAFKQALAKLETEIEHMAQSLLPEQRPLMVSLSRMSQAIATGETIRDLPSFKTNDNWINGLLNPLITAIKGGRTSMSAFRKSVGPDRLMQAADLFNSMRDERAFSEWFRRHSTMLSFKKSTNGK